MVAAARYRMVGVQIVVLSVLGCSVGSERSALVRVDATPRREKAEKQYEKGVAFFHQGKLAEAKFCLEQACAIDSTHGPAHNNLALVFMNQQELPEAAEHLAVAIELMPEDPRPLNNLGMVFETGGRRDEAMELYESAWALAPRNPLYLGNLVRAKIRIGAMDDVLMHQLRELVFIENRPEWRQWADEQLTLLERVSPKSASFESALATRGAQQTITDSPIPFELVRPVPPLQLEASGTLPPPE